MSKKAKALLIISSIALTLILSGSITWLIYGRNTVESASQSDNAVLTNKTTESSWPQQWKMPKKASATFGIQA